MLRCDSRTAPVGPAAGVNHALTQKQRPQAAGAGRGRVLATAYLNCCAVGSTTPNWCISELCSRTQVRRGRALVAWRALLADRWAEREKERT